MSDLTPRTAGHVDRDTLLSLSGLDVMHRILAGTLPGPPMAAALNFRLESVAEGHVVFRGSPLAAHTNPMGGVHGGWYGTVLDSAMGCAVMTRVPKGSVYTTLEYKVNMLRAVPVGAEMVCEAVTRHAGRSTAVAEATLIGAGDGKLYATASSTCIIMAMTP